MSRQPGLRALVVEHERATPAGLVFRWLEETGTDVDVLAIDADGREVDVRAYDLVVSLGSEFAAYDETIPWLAREEALLRTACAADVPVLGICFGGQLLARALGGTVFRSESSEIGWLPVRTSAPALVAAGPWFQWHFDTFTPPDGARVLADSPVGPQAFVCGRSLGVQFHPEVTPQIMEEWVRVYRHELDAEGVDPDRLLEDTVATADAARERSWRLFHGFMEMVTAAPTDDRRPQAQRS